VFEKLTGGWSDGHVNQVAKLDPDDGDAGDYFGGSVAISGDVIIVGASSDERDGRTHAKGSAYGFAKDSGWSDGHANQAAKLLPDIGLEDSLADAFGTAVAISSGTLVIGAPDDPINGLSGFGSGAVYVFESVGTSWVQQAKLDPSDGGGHVQFGSSVAVFSDTVVVGAHMDDDPNGANCGSVYVFEKGAGWSDGHANQVAKLDPDDGDDEDHFGASVAIEGDTVIIGARRDEDPNGAYAGSVYVFRKGAGWRNGHANQVAKLDPDDGDSIDYFGHSVALSGDTVIVGAWEDEDPNGSYAGSAYVFERGTGWSNGHANQVAKLDPADGGTGDRFGVSVAIAGNTVIVGACRDGDPNGSLAGSAYVFEKGAGWSNGHPNQVAKLDPSDGGERDYFGVAVAIGADTVVVGAYRDGDPNGSQAGSAYVFEKGGGWSDGHANQLSKIVARDGDEQDQFGCAVALEGSTLIVGAFQDADPNGLLSGSAYVFSTRLRTYLPSLMRDA
jgi:heptaprenylglyceryl phosphate synthase